MSKQNEWIDIEKKKPDQLEVDLKLKDGSTIICAYLEFDGDFYWKGTGRELFIDENYVASWRPHRREE